MVRVFYAYGDRARVTDAPVALDDFTKHLRCAGKSPDAGSRINFRQPLRRKTSLEHGPGHNWQETTMGSFAAIAIT